MTTAQDIIDRVEEKLNDLGNIRWEVPELIREINDAQALMLEAQPDLYEYTNPSVPVQQGSRQAVPTDCFLLFDVVELQLNGVYVSTPRRIKREVMDRQAPGWMGVAEEDYIWHWLQDDKERQFFYINPPTVTLNQTLRLRYAKYPSEVSDVSDTLDTPPEHINAVYYFCMMRSLEKDEKFSGSPQAERYGQMFKGIFNARTEGEAKADAQRARNEGT